MRRRRFLELSGLALGATGLPASASGAAPSTTDPTGLGTPTPPQSNPGRRGPAHPVRRRADVVVIGAGVFGSWTAFYLRRRGVSCTLVDAYGPGNPRSTSGGDTRQIRAGYGDREVYTRWAVEALARWRRWEEEWEEELLVPTGRLTLAPEVSDPMRETKAVLDRVGVENELLDADELVHRWPQINQEGVGVAHFEPTAAAIRAAPACRAVAEAFERLGGEFALGRAEPGRGAAGKLDSVALGDGSALEAATFVFACGPWLPRLFPDLLAERIATPRRDELYFGTPPGDARFSHPHLPNFSEPSRSFYGFPSIDYRGVKVAPVGGSVRFDPDTDERIVVGYQVKRARDYLALRFPELAGQPVVESRVCQLEDTPDGHFVIDRHPEWRNMWLAGGGSGHAFKHGPVLGDYISSRVLGEETDPELDRLFAL